MLTFTLCFTAAVTILSLGLALWKDPEYYWLGALASCIFSFFVNWSIGLYTLSITFVLLGLGLGHSMQWIKNCRHVAVAVLTSLAAWLLSVSTIDRYWLFFPLTLF